VLKIGSNALVNSVLLAMVKDSILACLYGVDSRCLVELRYGEYQDSPGIS
jgi:hypothetical protein